LKNYVSKICNSWYFIAITTVFINIIIVITTIIIIITTTTSSSSGATTLSWVLAAQLSLSILSRKVLQSAVASDTSNPQLEGEPEIRAFHLSPQEASSGRWNYEREMAEKFCRN
jgi:hypothetical protein